MYVCISTAGQRGLFRMGPISRYKKCNTVVFRLFLRKCMKEMFFLCAHRAQHGSFSAPHF